MIKIWKFDGIKFFIYTVSSNAFHQDALLQKFSGQHMHQNFHQNPSKLQFWWKAWCIWKEPKFKKSSKKYRKEGKNRFWWSLMNFVLEQTFYFWWNCLKCIKQFDKMIFFDEKFVSEQTSSNSIKMVFCFFFYFFEILVHLKCIKLFIKIVILMEFDETFDAFVSALNESKRTVIKNIVIKSIPYFTWIVQFISQQLK